MLLNKVVYNHINFVCRDMKAKKMGKSQELEKYFS